MTTRRNEELTIVSSSIYVGQKTDTGSFRNKINNRLLSIEDVRTLFCITSMCDECLIKGDLCLSVSLDEDVFINLIALGYVY